MTPERWQQVKEILHEALQKEPGERSAFVGQACQTDPSLRLDVESLLASKPGVAQDFLKSAPQDQDRILLTRGMRLGSYEILHLIGVGGMGEVYRAYDSRLGRDVAIKVLPRTLTSDPDRLRRFEQEARAAAALNHPNILVIHGIGTTDDAIPYVVSELLEGETLRECLRRGPLPIGKSVDLMLQITSGLGAAHEKGIIHRDLKPENLFLTTDGRLKILDFGLAKVIKGLGSSADSLLVNGQTEAGVVMGTVAYMSPEQVRGLAIDQRSDIFALGAIFYEMLSGQRAFYGETPADTISAILNHEPRDVSRVVPTVPRALGQLVHRCLEKNPANRCQSAAELTSALEDYATISAASHSLSASRRRWFAMVSTGLATLVLLMTTVELNLGGWRAKLLGGRSRPLVRSLAVLPLANLTGDSGQDYFVDGMTDELTTNLAQISGLRVTSRSSSMQFKDAKKPLPQIAKELDVEAVVEGSVARSEGRVRITAQLIDARSDQHVWAESYERELRDVLALQDEVARRITAEVGIKLAAGQQTHLVSTRVVNPVAHEAYLKGNFYWNRSNCDGSKKGLEYYNEAVAKDSAFAPAYVGLSQAYFTLGDWGCWPQEEAFLKSKAAALRALELDERLGSAHAWLGTLAYFHDLDWDNADREYKKAIDLDLNDAPAHLSYAVFLVSMGKQEQGLAEMRKALELDPTAELTNMVSVHILYLARQYDRAIEQAKNAIQFYPDSWGTYFWLGAAYESKGMYQQAIEAYLKSKSLEGAKPQDLDALRRAYQKSGIRGYWQQVLDTLDEPDECSRGTIYAHLDDKERAIKYLNQAFQHRCRHMRTLKVDSVYDSLRGDPRFQDLIARLRL